MADCTEEQRKSTLSFLPLACRRGGGWEEELGKAAGSLLATEPGPLSPSVSQTNISNRRPRRREW